MRIAHFGRFGIPDRPAASDMVGSAPAPVLAGYLTGVSRPLPAPFFGPSRGCRVLASRSGTRGKSQKAQLQSPTEAADRIPTAAGLRHLQDPPPGNDAEGTKVTLVSAPGPPKIPVLTSPTRRVAGAIARWRRGMTVASGSIHRRADGRAMMTRRRGTAARAPRAAPGVSRGAPTISVPDLSGWRLGRPPRSRWRAALGTVDARRTTDGSPGTVRRQRPRPGRSRPGNRGGIVVARGPQ